MILKKVFKFLGITFLSLFIISYVIFLATPLFVNLDGYKPEIQKLVKENTKLNLDYSKLKIYTTPLLSAGIVLDDVNLTFDDGSSLFKTSKIKGGVAIPSLLTLTVKTSKCYVENPNINLEIVESKQYKIVKLIEDIINENNAKPKEENLAENQIPTELIEKIRIKVPFVKITNYNLLANDLKTNHNLNLKGDELILGYSSKDNVVRAKTFAQLLSDNKQNILADVKMSVQIPKIELSEEEVDPEEKIQIPFINLVEIYQKYDLKTNVLARLKVRHANDLGYFVYGILNVDNLNLKLSEIRLPDSFLHAKFHGKQIQYESDIYAKSDEKISLLGEFKFDKHPRMKTHIESNEIHFDNLLKLATALLDSLNINNNLNQIQAKGYLIANTDIKTNFKKLKSEGSILIKEGSFVNPMYNIGIKNIVLNAIFDNNAMNIKDTQATINGSKLTMEGYIDNNSKADIKIDVNNLSLAELYNSFMPKEIKKLYKLNSAYLTAHIDIDGQLEKLNAKVKTKLNNLTLNDSKKTMFVVNKEANIDLFANMDEIKGKINNIGFAFNMPQIKTTTKIDNLNLDIDSNKISIKPFDFIYNNTSSINIKGDIVDYQKNPQIDIFAKANIKTKDILTTLGKEIAYYVPAKGVIPAKVSIKGDMKKQEILAQIYSDANNYISPIILNDVMGKPGLIHADIKINGDKIKIKNSGFYKKAAIGFSDDIDLNFANSQQLIDFTSIIDKNHINLLRISIPKELSGKIAIFNKSSFTTKGKITLNGNFDSLSYGGDLKVNNLNIPELLLKVKNIDLNLLSESLQLKLNEIDVNSSKINAELKADLKPAKIFKVSDIDVKSDFIDVDKAMVTADKVMKYVPASSNSTSNQSVDIPLLADGKIDIKKLKSGEIIIENIKSNLGIKNNNLLLNKLTCKAFKGDIMGDIKMHLITQLLTIKLKGKHIDADNMLVNAANMKDTLSGTMEFKTDISLKGATYLEQVKSLKGDIWFKMKNGVYGPFSKLENFFLAENIRENVIFKNTIGLILTPLTTIDSSHYETLEGKLKFKDGIAYLNPITSQGDILCVLISGNMNLVKNEIDSKVRVRLASVVSDLLGPLAVANPINLIKNTPGLNIATAKLFTIFSTVVTEDEYKQIPDFSSNHKDANATKFQIILKGDVAKPLKLVKSFKWLALQKDMDMAKEFSDKYVKEQEELAKQALIKQLQKEYEDNNKIKVGVEKVLQMDTTAPKVKELILEEVIKSKAQKASLTQEELEKKETLKQEAKEEVKQLIQNKAKEVINEKTKKQQEFLKNKINNALQEKMTAPVQNTTNEVTPVENKTIDPAAIENAAETEGVSKE